ncbi:glycosyltransferase family 2 protein [Basfia succiniciproducens]|uniref:glycosyltransferase family 2 protein n=1 Tax=Basfia succiniciproducens TaxID=653940 RepID=UPI0008B374B2|nr:glycosyltransferase family 2 protein [Basfia succiniciproducens]SEP68548.1 Glycosyltransferase involved in cell wall bisynthesis [Basfia succiniciproducens]
MNTAFPEISVIIPFYKTPFPKLEKCLESFLQQDFPSFELLLIDDGNPIEYRQMLGKYLESNTNISYFQFNSNKGVSEARNLGIDKAKGKYIVFCDSDDYVEKNHLSLLYSAIEHPFVDLAICGVCEQDYPVIDSCIERAEFVSSPSKYSSVQYINFMPNKILRRDLIIQNNLKFNSSFRLGEDALFLNQYIALCQKINCISNQSYHYVLDENSAMSSYHEKYWDWERLVIKSQFDLFSSVELSENENNYLKYWLYRKIRRAFSYYFNRRPDDKSYFYIFNQIISGELFSTLEKGLFNNRYFSFLDIGLVYFWKIFKAEGVYLTSKFLKLKQLIKKS